MTSILKKISAKEARDTFSTVINEVAFGHKHYAITRYDKDVAVMIPADEWKEIQKLLQRLEDEEDIRDADDAHLRFKKEGGISHDEVKRVLGM